MHAEYEKIVQAINYFARRCRNRTISKLYALKVIFLADRYHLRMYGRTITNDRYFAMQYGPVASLTKSVIEHRSITPEQEDYAARYLQLASARCVTSCAEPDMEVFSQTDVEAMEAAWRVYQQHRAGIVAFTHRFPEWRNHESALRTESCVEMNLLDSFLPAPANVEYCPADAERVQLNRELFEEMSAVI